MENSAPGPEGRPGVRCSRARASAPQQKLAFEERAIQRPLPGARDSASPHEPPELRLVEQRDPVPLLAQPLDLHQLQPAVAARRPAAHWAGRGRRRWSAPTARRGRSRRRASRRGSRRCAAALRMPVNARWTPFERSQRRRPSARPAGAAARRSSRRRSRSASAARRCSGRRSPSGDRCTAAAGRRAVRIRALRVALDQHARAAARPDTRRRAPATSARRRRGCRSARQRVHRARGDAAPVALLPDDAEVAELQAPACRRRRRSAA